MVKIKHMVARALVWVALMAVCPAGAIAWEKKDVVGVWNYTIPREMLSPELQAELPEMSASLHVWQGGDGKLKGYYVNLFKIKTLYDVRLEKDVLSIQDAKVAKGPNGGSGPIDKGRSWRPTFEYFHVDPNDPTYVPIVFKWSAIPTDNDVPDAALTGEYTGELISDVNGKSKTVKSTVTLKLASATDDAGGKIRIETQGAIKTAEAPELKIKLIDRFHNQIYFEWDEPGSTVGPGAFLGTISSGKISGIVNTRTGNGRAALAKVRK